MTDLVFKISQNIILGSYTISKLAQNASEWGSRFMIIIDPSLKETNAKDQILGPLDERGLEYFVYDNVITGESTENIMAALKLAKQARVDAVIAIGITNVLLLGVAVASLFNEESSIYDVLDASSPVASVPLPLICVPTTVRIPYIFTPYIPIIDSRSRMLKLLRVQNGLCKLVLWDSELTLTLPQEKKVSTAIETLSLAFEAFISQKSTFFSDMFSLKAMELLSYGMTGRAYGKTTLEQTTPTTVLLTEAGFLSSIATSCSSVGVGSLISAIVNAKYNLSRSTVAAILFPHIIEDALLFKKDRVQKLADIYSIESPESEDKIKNFIKFVRQKIVSASLPLNLNALGLTIDQLALCCEEAKSLDIINTLPRSMTSDDLFDLLKKAF